ncbi:MAG: 6-methylsalicylate decarboxylase [Mycobacterium sp.]|nr:6-methylsalicylate decarboxylase [Mycobacterium sp.]
MYLGQDGQDELWSALDARSAVVFIHPADLPGPTVPGVAPFAADFLLDTTRAAYLLVRNGIRRKNPNIKFILSHAGGFVPYASHRMAVGIMPTPAPARRTPLMTSRASTSIPHCPPAPPHCPHCWPSPNRDISPSGPTFRSRPWPRRSYSPLGWSPIRDWTAPRGMRSSAPTPSRCSRDSARRPRLRPLTPPRSTKWRNPLALSRPFVRLGVSGQNADSGRRMMSSSRFSMMPRSALRRGSMLAAKYAAVAILPR